ncbi:MAG: HNH endonuclease [Deltaproteobacteria bacterium]|nr:HNH endonuclease [Deltaproteobacteria bacterium]
MTDQDRGAIGLAERMLGLLDEGSFSATYKYALLMALLDLCLEKMSGRGVPPETVTTRQLAEKVVELYWPHAAPYRGQHVLRQGGVRQGNQAEIVSAIAAHRAGVARDPDQPVFRARLADPERFEKLVRFVEWKLIEMPIPRLQWVGPEEIRFLYEYAWTKHVRQSEVSAYQRGAPRTFDNRLLLRAGVAENLVRLNGLLRPLLHREWARMVAAMNRLPESELDDFLFGATRVPLDPVRAPLLSLQAGRCFYCQTRLSGPSEVDHFIPWARYPNNGLENLVVAHARCNNRKRDFLAAARHVENWSGRARAHASDLEVVASELDWERDPSRSRSVAVAIYSRLPEEARLWERESELVAMERPRILAALGRLAA